MQSSEQKFFRKQDYISISFQNILCIWRPSGQLIIVLSTIDRMSRSDSEPQKSVKFSYPLKKSDSVHIYIPGRNEKHPKRPPATKQAYTFPT